MKTHEDARLGGWVRRFLVEHLVVERNLSGNTQRSYRDTLRLLIPFAADAHKTAVDRLSLQIVTQDLSCAASQTFESWNQIAGWLRRLEGLERAG